MDDERLLPASLHESESLFFPDSEPCCQKIESHAGGGGDAPAHLAVLTPSWCFNLFDYTDLNDHEMSPSAESRIRSNAGGVVLGGGPICPLRPMLTDQRVWRL